MNFILSFLSLVMTWSAFAQKPKEYTIPVLFDFTQATKKTSYGFSYQMNESGLNLDNLGRIDEQTFSLRFLSAEEVKKVPQDMGAGTFLQITYPSMFFTEFEVQWINKSGKSLLTKKITSEMLNRFPNEKSTGKVSQVAFGGIDSVLTQISAEKEPVKICMTQTRDNMFTRLCSRSFGIIERNKLKEIKYEGGKDSGYRVLIENEKAPLSHTVQIKDASTPIRAFFELQNGIVFEMVNRPKVIEFVEVTQEGSNFKFFGSGNLPLGAVKRERQSLSFFNNMIPFDSTIGDFRDYYHLMTSSDNVNPMIITKGEAGGLFQFYITLEKIPKDSDRIYFLEDTPNSTYLDKFKVYASSDKKIKFNSRNNVKSSDKSNDFTWTTTLDKKGDFNKTSLEYEKDGQKNLAYFEVYRGFSQEFSLKTTVINSKNQTVILGEMSYNKWFEDFGTRPGSLLYQRLGIGLNYFKSLQQIEVDDQGAKASLESTNVALKYRFTPGLWNWDESWGAIVSYQGLKYEDISAPLVGAGLFWARSMPAVFDSLFNLIPFFRYPKWVDMDFVYFPTSLDSKIKTKDSMVLNFHGKILWTKQIYGEAGFGYKTFSLETPELGTETRSMYLTLGLGLNF